MNAFAFCATYVAICAAAFAMPVILDDNLFSQTIPSFAMLVLFLAWLKPAFFDRQRGSVLLSFLAVIGGLSSLFRWIPMPLGANAFFFLPAMVAHVMGPVFGTIAAALAMLMSGFLGGGIGPWLPYQVLASGALGMLCGWTAGRAKGWLMLAAAFGALAYGMLMNLWFWPTLEDIEGGYVSFYLATSALWDIARAGALVVMIVVFYPSIQRILVRYNDRWGPQAR